VRVGRDNRFGRLLIAVPQRTNCLRDRLYDKLAKLKDSASDRDQLPIQH